MTHNVPRLVFRWQIQHQAVTNINKSLNLTASCQKYHKTCHLKQTDVAHSIIFSRTEKFNATFIHKVWFGFQFSAKFFVENCLWRFSTKFGFSFPLSRKIFRLQFSLIFLRKNRSEAFCVSSENTLYTTFHGLFSGGKFSTKPSQIYTNY